MKESCRDWANRIPYALWRYCTSIKTPTEATPYSLVSSMEVVLVVKLEVPSLRVMLESQVNEED